MFLDSTDAPKLIQETTGNAPIRLAFDGVSGPATGRLATIVSSDSTIVGYSAMSGAPISIRPLDVIFKRIAVRGFLPNDFDFVSLVRPAIEQAAKLVAAGLVRAPVAAIYPLSAIKEAVTHTQRGGKVLLHLSRTMHRAA